MSDAFGKWYAEHPRFDYDEALEVWQAAERQALERAALKCDEEALWLERLTEHEQSCGAHKCAFEIRALIEQSASKEKQEK